jgi:D-glycero-alpha-D-manno-heptose-7-phosphate kinase
MLIARAPVRISFAGGGTDLPAFFLQHGGAVVSATLDKYVYVILTVHGGPELQILSSDYRTFYRHTPGEALFWQGDLNLPKAILHEFGLDHSVSMFLASEVPPGTGLGSSSTLTVAAVKAVSAARGQTLSKAQVARLATRIELEKMGMPIGYQDQYAAAYGGLNFIEFGPASGLAESVRVTPLRTPPGTLEALQARLLLFFTGTARESSQILARQRASTERSQADVVQALTTVRDMAYGLRDSLVRGDLDGFGQWLHAGWEQKKRFADGVTNAAVDEAYALARANGALGGKLAGAGGGGFMLLYCPPDREAAVTQALADLGLRRMDFRFEEGGASVLLNAGLRLPELSADDRRQTMDDGLSGLAAPSGPAHPQPHATRNTHHASSEKPIHSQDSS